MSLLFTPSSHRYRMSRTPDEKKRDAVPGVTGLLDKGLPKPALKFWAAKSVAEYVADEPEQVEKLRAMGRGPMVAALKETPYQQRDEAAIKGTAIHAIAERIVHGEQVDVDELLMPYIEGYIEWLDAWNVKPLITERSMGNRRWWYAGRADFRGEIGGRLCTGDWKSAKGVYGDNGLQLAAYDNCEFYVDDDDPDTEYPIEPTGSLAVVHIQPYETRHYWVKSPDDCWRWFQHVAYTGRNADNIKNCLGPAEPLPDTESSTTEGAA